MTDKMTRLFEELEILEERYPQGSDHSSFSQETSSIILGIFEEVQGGYEGREWECIPNTSSSMSFQLPITSRHTIQMDWIQSENAVAIRVTRADREATYPRDFPVWASVSEGFGLRVPGIQSPRYVRSSDENVLNDSQRRDIMLLLVMLIVEYTGMSYS